MDSLINLIAEMFNIPYNTAEGGVATFFAFMLVIAFKLLWDASRRDKQQIDLEQTLAQLALDSFSASTQTIKDNTLAIQKIGNLLDNMQSSFTDLAQEIKNVVSGINSLAVQAAENKPVLDDIKDNLIKTSKTMVIVKDSQGDVIAKFTAQPDEEGNLVVQFNSTLVEESDKQND